MITIAGRTLYSEDVGMFLEWFVYKMGTHSKTVMDALMDGRLVIAGVEGLTDDIVGGVFEDISGMKDEVKRLERLLVIYANTIDELEKKLRTQNVDLLENRLMDAEKMLSRIGMSLNYKENVK